MASGVLVKDESVERRNSRMDREHWSEREIDEVRKKATGGDMRAQALLGALYASGSLGRVDNRLAFKWYSKAAEAGLDDAQYNLGLMYLMGEGTTKNRDVGMRLVRAAARKGYDIAEEALGQIYESGAWGVRKNLARAIRWYDTAAQHGNDRARFSLGALYVGRNTVSDRRRGVRLIREAAKAGVIAAKDYLRNQKALSGKKQDSN